MGTVEAPLKHHYTCQHFFCALRPQC